MLYEVITDLLKEEVEQVGVVHEVPVLLLLHEGPVFLVHLGGDGAALAGQRIFLEGLAQPGAGQLGLALGENSYNFV